LKKKKEKKKKKKNGLKKQKDPRLSFIKRKAGSGGIVAHGKQSPSHSQIGFEFPGFSRLAGFNLCLRVLRLTMDRPKKVHENHRFVVWEFLLLGCFSDLFWQEGEALGCGWDRSLED
jgi:hypothetical protein